MKCTTSKAKKQNLGENICITANDIKYIKGFCKAKIKQPQRKTWARIYLTLIEKILFAR